MSENRKVVQVTTMVVPGMDNMATPMAEVIVLCDDGTLWRGDGHGWWQEISTPTHYGTLLREAQSNGSRLGDELRAARKVIRDTHDWDARAQRCSVCGSGNGDLSSAVCAPKALEAGDE